MGNYPVINFDDLFDENKKPSESEAMFELRKALYSGITDEMVDKIKERLLGFKEGQLSEEVKNLLKEFNITLPK